VAATGQNVNSVWSILNRVTGTWEYAMFLLVFSVVCIPALSCCLGMWLSSSKHAFHASVFGLSLGMVQVSLGLGNLSAGLTEYVRVIIPC